MTMDDKFVERLLQEEADEKKVYRALKRFCDQLEEKERKKERKGEI